MRLKLADTSQMPEGHPLVTILDEETGVAVGQILELALAIEVVARFNAYEKLVREVSKKILNF